MWRIPIIVLLSAFIAAGSATALAASRDDPDWPCVQRLVLELTSPGVWPGSPPQPAENWIGVAEVRELIAQITPRGVTAQDGVRAINSFLAPRNTAERQRMVPLAFTGILDTTNHTRQQLIERIKVFSRRQRSLAELIQRLSGQLESIPPEAAGTAADQRVDLQQRVFFATKSFQDSERTVRYMCEAPVQLEARLGTYARALAAALPASSAPP